MDETGKNEGVLLDANGSVLFRTSAESAGGGTPSEPTQKVLENLRTRLLDLTNRNRLLNFKFSDRARTHARIIDEIPDILYSKLLEGESLVFKALPEPEDELSDEHTPEFFMAFETARKSDEEYAKALDALDEEDETSAVGQRIERELKDRVREQLGLPPRPTQKAMTPADYATARGFNPSYDLPESPDGTEDDESHLDEFLQTLLFPDQMERKLAGIRTGAQTSLSEMGVNTLYVAFGYLEWFESDDSDKKMFAPLLLHPLELERTLVGGLYRYAIRSTGEDDETNLTLSERLRNDFGFQLPTFDEEDTPEAYWAKVEDAITEMKRWRVRRFVTVGLFSFGRIAMFHDLDESKWPPDRKPASHGPIVDVLRGGKGGESLTPSEYEVDSPDIESKIPILIADADSSQISAMVDVNNGRNLAIKGPPGTGKSQTITNIIAASLAAGKTVLFVAEKMAALEVVKKRLDNAAELGFFCLELHSSKARKKDVLEALEFRMELGELPPPKRLNEEKANHAAKRKLLSDYAELINSEIENGTIYEVIWGATLARDEARALELDSLLRDVEIHRLRQHGRSTYEDQRELALTLERCAKSVDRVRKKGIHPWQWVINASITPFQQEKLADALEKLRVDVGDLSVLCQRLSEKVPLSQPVGLPDVRHVIHLHRLLEKHPDCNKPLIPMLRAESDFAEFEQWQDMLHRKILLTSELEQSVEEPAQVAQHVVRLASASEIKESIRGVRGLDDVEVHGLPALEQQYASAAEQIRAVILLTERALSLAAIEDEVTPSSVSAVARVLELLLSTSHHAIVSGLKGKMDADSHIQLSRAMGQADELSESLHELKVEFSIRDSEDAESLHNDAIALRGSGFLGRIFGKEFRAAKAKWRGLRKEPIKAKPSTMAAELERIAEVLEAVSSFECDKKISDLCGEERCTLNTDFGSALEVAKFVHQVDELFPASPGRVSPFRELLLSGSSESLLELRDVASSDSLSIAKEVSKRFGSKKEDAPLPLAKVYDRYRETAESVGQLHEKIVNFGLTANFKVGEIPNLATDLQDLCLVAEHLASATSGSSPLLAVVKPEDALDDDNVQAIEVARACLDEKVPDCVVRALCLDIGPQDGFAKLVDQLNVTVSVVVTGLDSPELAQQIDVGQLVDGKEPSECVPTHLLSGLDFALSHQHELAPWLDYCRARQSAHDGGLQELVAVYEREQLPFNNLEVAFKYAYYRTLLKKVYEEHPELARLSGSKLDETRKQFQAFDEFLIELMQHDLASRLSKADIPWGNNKGRKSEYTDLHLIRNEIGKKRRHIPLRDLLDRAGSAVQAMKPCWMMSPASVANFLRQDGVEFDLLVIDEASQMKPEEAIGAMARCKQTVVVGDPQQLPPTTFFDRVQEVDEDDEDADEYVDTEPILDLALSAFTPSRELRWHYRSRHESLIAFSNKHFYDENLVVFPSPHNAHNDLGVVFEKVDGMYKPRASVNVVEAQRIAQAALDHVLEYPNRTIGLVTINQSQCELVLEEVDRLFALHPKADKIRRDWEDTLEPFFVKNLENVQGDERDVILISTVYGPREGFARMPQRFGPINNATGHRRLNVLFSRAREKVMVFSSMEPMDVLPTETSRRGVRVLRDYLEYAQSGEIVRAKITGREPDSDFEVCVAERLRREGLEVVPQVGVAGYFIDMAVRDPNNPSEFLFGVECDGATYHSAKSARDRDRLRQEILEGLGWTLYRVWSTDWYSDPDGETRKLCEFARQLQSKDSWVAGD